MHSERAPWYLRLATWGGVIFLHFPLLIIAIYAFNTEDAAFSFPPQGLTLRWFSEAAGRSVHLDLGVRASEGYGIPVTVVPRSQPRLPLGFGVDGEDYRDESDRGPVFVPADAEIEGGSARDADPELERAKSCPSADHVGDSLVDRDTVRPARGDTAVAVAREVAFL